MMKSATFTLAVFLLSLTANAADMSKVIGGFMNESLFRKEFNAGFNSNRAQIWKGIGGKVKELSVSGEPETRLRLVARESGKNGGIQFTQFESPHIYFPVTRVVPFATEKDGIGFEVHGRTGRTNGLAFTPVTATMTYTTEKIDHLLFRFQKTSTLDVDGRSTIIARGEEKNSLILGYSGPEGMRSAFFTVPEADGQLVAWHINPNNTVVLILVKDGKRYDQIVTLDYPPHPSHSVTMKPGEVVGPQLAGYDGLLAKVLVVTERLTSDKPARGLVVDMSGKPIGESAAANAAPQSGIGN